MQILATAKLTHLLVENKNHQLAAKLCSYTNNVMQTWSCDWRKNIY